MTSPLTLLTSAAGLVFGLSMLIFPERFRRNHMRNKDREIADRMARGKDAYFEELRTLQAYHKPGSVPTVRFFGGLLALGSAAVLVMHLVETSR